MYFLMSASPIRSHHTKNSPSGSAARKAGELAGWIPDGLDERVDMRLILPGLGPLGLTDPRRRLPRRRLFKLLSKSFQRAHKYAALGDDVRF